MRNCNNTQKSTWKPPLVPVTQHPVCPFFSLATPAMLVCHNRDQQCSAMLRWAPAPDPAGTSLCLQAAMPAWPSHQRGAWHLLWKQVVLQRWPQTLLLLQTKEVLREGQRQVLHAPWAGQNGCCAVLRVREFSAIKLPSTTLKQVTFREWGSIVIPSTHFCERSREKLGLFTYKSIAMMMYYYSWDYQINNAGSLKLVFKQIYFQKERKTYLNHPEKSVQNILTLIFWQMLHTWQEDAEILISTIHLKNYFSSWVKTILTSETWNGRMEDFLPLTMLSTQTLHRPRQSMLMFCFTYFSKSQILPSIEPPPWALLFFFISHYYGNVLLEKKKTLTSYWKTAGLLII